MVLYRYLRRLIAAAFLHTALTSVFPEKFGGRMIGLVCSLFLFVTAGEWFVSIDPSDVAAAISRVEMAKIEDQLEFSVDNDEIVAAIIKERSESYILNQGLTLGIQWQTIDVVVEKGGEYPYPAAVTLNGCFTRQQRIDLTKWIEMNLAIPEAKQSWVSVPGSPIS